MIKRILLGFLFLSAPYDVVAKNLPLPSFPASFEVAEYQGEKGCIPNSLEYRFAVTENEGMANIGRHSMLSTASEELHIMELLHNLSGSYGYMMSNKADGKLCISERMNNLKFRSQVEVPETQHSEVFNTKDCSFTPSVINLCGSFEHISGRLIKAGYRYDWQAKKINGNILTMLSGSPAEQSWILETSYETGATIFVGAGKGEFKFN
jgi:hypothetical protein